MTDPSDFEQREARLPGLEPAKRGEAPIVLAARRSIVALRAEGLLQERHAILTQQLLDLADALDAGRRSGRASAVAMAAAQIIATWQLLVPADLEGGGSDDAWSELVADLRRSAAAVRDTT